MVHVQYSQQNTRIHTRHLTYLYLPLRMQKPTASCTTCVQVLSMLNVGNIEEVRSSKAGRLNGDRVDTGPLGLIQVQ